MGLRFGGLVGLVTGKCNNTSPCQGESKSSGHNRCQRVYILVVEGKTNLIE